VNKTSISVQGWMLRLEGLGALLLAGTYYNVQSGDWMLFAMLALAPDLSFIGYLLGQRIGAIAYNLMHTYSIPLVLFTIGWLSEIPMLVSVTLIWFIHIGADRVLGYGLKYPSGFKDTHLERV
jgi:hypothetical protein